MTRYCKRHRKMSVVIGVREDGTALLSDPVPALITRYRFGLKRRKPHYVYWHEGVFYRARNRVIELDEAGKPCGWQWALEPIAKATAHDAHRAQTIADGKAAPVVLEIRDGRASAHGLKGTAYEGLQLLDGSEPAEYVADLLDLDRPETRPAGKHFKAA